MALFSVVYIVECDFVSKQKMSKEEIKVGGT